MRRINEILREEGMLIMLVLIVAWVLWATQLGGLFKKGFYGQLEMYKTGQVEKERRVFEELTALGLKLGDKAKEKAAHYTPELYFKDLRILYEKGQEGGIRPAFATDGILTAIMHSIKYVENGEEKFAKEGKVFNEWREKFYPDEKIVLPTSLDCRNWAISFYLRTMFLLAIAYITKMADRKGILETILADKTKFVLAIVCWPALFTKYPYNVIREIRVEAELRRLGNLFRKLSPRELTLVREVANSSNYRQWLNQERKYSRGLALALLITVTVNLLPSIALGAIITNDLEAVIQQIETGGQIEDDARENIETTMPAIIEEPKTMEPPILIAAIEPIETPWENTEPEDIDCIPEASLFESILTKILIQIAKGINHEKFNHYLNRINYRINLLHSRRSRRQPVGLQLQLNMEKQICLADRHRCKRKASRT